MKKKRGESGFTKHGGKYCMAADNSEGYEKLGDKIYPAPCTAQFMHQIVEREMGLRDYIDAMNHYVIEQFRVLCADKKRFWDGAVMKYELDPSIPYQWNQAEGSIAPVPKKDSEAVRP